MNKANNFLDNLGSCLEVLAASALFFLIGAALSWWGWSILQKARVSAEWPSVSGQITESNLEFDRGGEDGDTYTPRVSYSYTVNSVSYESYAIKFGENTYSSEREAQEILARYPAGQVVQVYYDPSDPDSAILEPGVSGGSYIVLSVGLLFVVLSLLPPPFYLARSLWSRRASARP